jgi:hypothetical protein
VKSDRISELFQRSAYYIAFRRDVTKTCKLPPSLSPPPLMVYSEQVKRRRSPNEDTLQYLHSFVENIDIVIVISVLLACLCRVVFFVTFALIAGGGGGRCFLVFCPFSPSDGRRISSEHDRFITAPHARNLGHHVRVNYSELHNGVNQLYGQTCIRQGKVTAVSSLERRRTKSEVHILELTTLSMHFD